MGAVSKTLKTTTSCLKTVMSYKRADRVQKCRCWRPAASHWMQGRDAVAPFHMGVRPKKISLLILTYPTISLTARSLWDMKGY